MSSPQSNSKNHTTTTPQFVPSPSSSSSQPPNMPPPPPHSNYSPSYFWNDHHNYFHPIPTSMPRHLPHSFDQFPPNYNYFYQSPMNFILPSPPPPWLSIPCNYHNGGGGGGQDDHMGLQIVKQIEYYFSDENLSDDFYLRGKMDGQGWVHIDVIAEFRRVKSLTSNVHYILDVLYRSSVLHVRGYKVRCRDWRRWILTPNSQIPPDKTNNTAH